MTTPGTSAGISAPLVTRQDGATVTPLRPRRPSSEQYAEGAADTVRGQESSTRTTAKARTTAKIKATAKNEKAAAAASVAGVRPLTPPSFTSYVRQRGPVLLRTARSLTANPSDAEDLLQTALTKTYLAWERIEDHRALDGYVRRALINTRTSQWRKRRVDEFPCEELPEPDAQPGPDPAEHQAMRDAMWRAVLKLPARQRAMVVLRYYEDLSEAQTAEIMNVSVGTVKSAVSRALAKLRNDPQLTADTFGAAA